MVTFDLRRLISALRSALNPDEVKNLSAPLPLLALDRSQRPQWTQRSYHAFAREGFAGNVVGYRCIRMISERPPCPGSSMRASASM
jgi:hypothetical protein